VQAQVHQSRVAAQHPGGIGQAAQHRLFTAGAFQGGLGLAPAALGVGEHAAQVGGEEEVAGFGGLDLEPLDQGVFAQGGGIERGAGSEQGIERLGGDADAQGLASISSRTSTMRLLPPRLADGILSLSSAQSSSAGWLESEVDAVLLGTVLDGPYRQLLRTKAAD
jgi:hypothetical protein